MKYVAFKITDELLLKKILTSGKRKQAVWEVGTFFAPFPVQEKKGERPYFPKTFLILDSKTGLILGHEMVKDISEEGYHCIQCQTDLIVDSKIPSRILVEREETYHFIKDVCHQLNISLERVEQLATIPQVREEMFSKGW